ncbi:MAG: SDR family oxidoreductase [Wenzhouxiangella sp.]
MKRLLIAGCGDLGMRLSRRLDPGAWTIHGLRRHPEQLPRQIEPVKADLQDPATLAPAAGHWDAIVYQATPDERTPEAYRAAYVQGLNNLLGGCSVERLIFVSSTGVYGQDAGEWVDELAATEPRAFSGEILLEAEAVTARHGGLIVRFSGIYGPGRDFLIRSLRAGRARCRPKPPQWTNRIHSEDCAGVLAHLLTLPAPAPVYCASDSRPAPRCEVLGWLADQLGVAAPAIDEQAAGQGKRISNQRLLDSGYSFQYPDYITGYRELLP